MYIQFQYPVKVISSNDYFGREFDVVNDSQDREGNQLFTLQDRGTGEELEETFFASELEEII